MPDLRRREFISLLGGAGLLCAAKVMRVRAQQPAMPSIGFLSIRSSGTDARFLTLFHQGLNEGGFLEGRNVAVEYRYAEGQLDRLPTLVADLVQRQVAVIVTTGGVEAALAAKAATSTIPIVFSTGGDPVREGLVHSLNRPERNLTGVTTSFSEAASKRLGLLREISRKDAIIGVLVNPNDSVPASSEINDMRTAAVPIGQRLEILQAGTERDIDETFASLTHLRVDALLVAPHALFATQAHQLVALAARHAIPTLYWRPRFTSLGPTAPEFLEAKNPAICQFSNRPNSSWSSILRPRRRWVWTYRPHCSRRPTR
jgi:putative tryptophan/tyrosine transport system substrate-binding protein